MSPAMGEEDRTSSRPHSRAGSAISSLTPAIVKYIFIFEIKIFIESSYHPLAFPSKFYPTFIGGTKVNLLFSNVRTNLWAEETEMQVYSGVPKSNFDIERVLAKKANRASSPNRGKIFPKKDILVFDGERNSSQKLFVFPFGVWYFRDWVFAIENLSTPLSSFHRSANLAAQSQNLLFPEGRFFFKIKSFFISPILI